jgi:hypothetical protein
MGQLVRRGLGWSVAVLAALLSSAGPAWAVGASGAPPTLSRVSVSTGLRGTGQTFNFTLNEPARVTFRFTRRGVTALRVRVGGRAGRNHYSLAARKLKPGRYTVTLTVRDACGRVSSRKTLTFTATI